MDFNRTELEIIDAQYECGWLIQCAEIGVLCMNEIADLKILYLHSSCLFISLSLLSPTFSLQYIMTHTVESIVRTMHCDMLLFTHFLILITQT